MSKIQDPKTGAKPAKAASKGVAKEPAKSEDTPPPAEKPKAQEPSARPGWRTHTASGAAPVAGKKSDGFEKQQQPGGAAAKKTAKPALAAPSGAAPSGVPMMKAKDPGVLFRERRAPDGGQATAEDTDLAAAVEQARELLKPVAGIEHIGPGENEQGQPVVLIAARDGFTEASLRAIPGRVGGFRTLLALPYELLPLPAGVSAAPAAS
jgi:hypothetical protein